MTRLKIPAILKSLTIRFVEMLYICFAFIKFLSMQRGSTVLFPANEVVLYNCTTRIIDPDQEVVCSAGGKIGMTSGQITTSTKVAKIRTKLDSDFMPTPMFYHLWRGAKVDVPVDSICYPRFHLMATVGDIYLYGCPPQLNSGPFSLQWAVRCKLFVSSGNIIERVGDIYSTDFLGWRPARPDKSTPPQRLPLLPHQDNMNYKHLKSAMVCGFSPMVFSPTSSVPEWHVSLPYHSFHV